MITLAKFSIEEVLPFTGASMPRKIYCVDGVQYHIKMNSLRYQTFQKSLNCVNCKLTGDFFLLQYHQFNYKKTAERFQNCFIKDCGFCDTKKWMVCHRTPKNEVMPHFNLYHVGKHNGLILMTKDHILPKSKGGRDHIDNLQTMCVNCNVSKSDTIPEDLCSTLLF